MALVFSRYIVSWVIGVKGNTGGKALRRWPGQNVGCYALQRLRASVAELRVGAYSELCGHCGRDGTKAGSPVSVAVIVPVQFNY